MRHYLSVIVATLFVGFSAQLFEAHAQQTKSAPANQCDEHLKVHGLLSRAYTQCNFTFYSRGFTIQADDCTRKLGEKDSKQLLLQGRTAFDERVKQLGQPVLCAKILKDFPYTVRQ